MPIHPSTVLAEKAHLALRTLDDLFETRGVTQADRAALLPARLALKRVRDRHRAALGLSAPVEEVPHAAPF